MPEPMKCRNPHSLTAVDWTLPGCLVLMILVAAIIGGIMWALK